MSEQEGTQIPDPVKDGADEAEEESNEEESDEDGSSEETEDSE